MTDYGASISTDFIAENRQGGYYSNNHPRYLIDDLSTSYWASDGTATEPKIVFMYVGDTYGQGGKVRINKIGLRQNATSQSLKSFKLYGSASGDFTGEEIELLNVVNTAALVADEEREWEFANTEFYQYFMVHIYDKYSTYISLEWIKFFPIDGVTFRQDIVDLTNESEVAATATLTASSTYSGFDVANLNDDASTVWLATGANDTDTIDIDFGVGNSEQLVKIGFQAPPDNLVQIFGAISKISGSNTGAFAGEETDLFTWPVGNDFGKTWAEGEKIYLQFENENSYRYYRLAIERQYQIGVYNYKRFAELEIYATDASSGSEASVQPVVFIIT